MAKQIEKWILDRLDMDNFDRVQGFDGLLQDTMRSSRAIGHLLYRYKIIKEAEYRSLLQSDNINANMVAIRIWLRRIMIKIDVKMKNELIEGNVLKMKLLFSEIYLKLCDKDSDLFVVAANLIYKTDARAQGSGKLKLFPKEREKEYIKQVDSRTLLESCECATIVLKQKLAAEREEKKRLREENKKFRLHCQEINKVLLDRNLKTQERRLKLAQLNVERTIVECRGEVEKQECLEPEDMMKFEFSQQEQTFKNLTYDELLDLKEEGKAMESYKPNMENSLDYLNEIKEKVRIQREQVEELMKQKALELSNNLLAPQPSIVEKPRLSRAKSAKLKTPKKKKSAMKTGETIEDEGSPNLDESAKRLSGKGKRSKSRTRSASKNKLGSRKSRTRSASHNKLGSSRSRSKSRTRRKSSVRATSSMRRTRSSRKSRKSLSGGRKSMEQQLRDMLERDLEIKQQQEEEFSKAKQLFVEEHRRKYKEYLCRQKRCLKELGHGLIEGVMDLAIRSIKYKEVCENEVPDDIFSEWKRLFVYGVPIHDIPFCFPPTCKCDSSIFLLELDKLVGFKSTDITEFIKYLNREKEYASPWSDPDHHILDHIVNELLKFKYCDRLERKKSKFRVNVRACLVTDLTDQRDSFIDQLRQLLTPHLIEIVTFNDARNFCINQYVQEKNAPHATEQSAYSFHDEFDGVVDEFGEFKARILSPITIPSRNQVNQKASKRSKSSRMSQSFSRKKMSKGRLSKRKSLMSRSQGRSLSKAASRTRSRSKSRMRSRSRTRSKSRMSKSRLSFKSASSSVVDLYFSENATVATQTAFPDYVKFSKVAELGKQLRIIHNENRTPDALLTINVLYQYLKQLKSDFVLIDFPASIFQIENFEKFFTGLSPNLLNMRPTGFSRLCPRDKIPFESFFTDYIVMQKGYFNEDDELILDQDYDMKVSVPGLGNYTISPEHQRTIREFYGNIGIFTSIRYPSIRSKLIKFIARVIIGDMAMPRKPSDELFSATKEPLNFDVISLLSNDPSLFEDSLIRTAKVQTSATMLELDRCCDVCEDAVKQEELEWGIISERAEVKPPPYEYVSLNPISSEKRCELATFWEKLESEYTLGLSEILCSRYEHLQNCQVLKSDMRSKILMYLERPTVDKTLTDQLRDMYFGFEDMLREKADPVYLESVANAMGNMLFDLCDKRLDQMVCARRDLMAHHLLPSLIVNLANAALVTMGFELKRFHNTLKLLHMYYSAIINKESNYELPDMDYQDCISLSIHPNNEVPIYFEDFPPLPCIPYEEQPCDIAKCYSKVCDAHFDPSMNPYPDKEYLMKYTKLSPPEVECILKLIKCTKSQIISIQRPPEVVKILKQKESFYRNAATTIKSGLLDVIRSEKFVYESKCTNAPDLSAILIYEHDPYILKRLKAVQIEAENVINTEFRRLSGRLMLIQSVVANDIKSIVEVARDLFQYAAEHITERYEHEKRCVEHFVELCMNEIAFSEGEVKRRSVLDNARFIFQTHHIYFPRRPTPDPPYVPKDLSHLQLSYKQLADFIHQMRYIAPNGNCCRKTLAYYLKDITGCACYDGRSNRVPDRWHDLSQIDIEVLLRKCFGCIPRVDWRDFILNAMGIQFPTIDELLEMREEFKRYALVKEIEIISKKNYNKCRLWFEVKDKRELSDEEYWRNFKLKALLFKMYKTHCSGIKYTSLLLGLCKSDVPKIGFAMALSLYLGTRVNYDWSLGSEYERLTSEEYEFYCRNMEFIIEPIIEQLITDAFNECAGYKIRDATLSDFAFIERKLRHAEMGSEYESTEPEGQEEDFMEMEIAPETECEASYTSLSITSSYHSFRKLKIDPFVNTLFWIDLKAIKYILELTFPWYRQIRDEENYDMITGIEKAFNEIQDELAEFMDPMLLEENKCSILAHRIMDRYYIRKWIERGLKFRTCSPTCFIDEILEKRTPKSIRCDENLRFI